MTQFNKYETRTLGVYGNGSETIFVNKHGRAFVVESPDILNTGRGPIPTDNHLPTDMVALGDKDCADLEVPDWVYDAR